jgi:hypothetical protein
MAWATFDAKEVKALAAKQEAKCFKVCLVARHLSEDKKSSSKLEEEWIFQPKYFILFYFISVY